MAATAAAVHPKIASILISSSPIFDTVSLAGSSISSGSSGGASRVSFAALPNVDHKTRRYRRPLGVAARSGILIQQRQKRNPHANQDAPNPGENTEAANPELYSPTTAEKRKEKSRLSHPESPDGELANSKEGGLRFWKRISRRTSTPTVQLIEGTGVTRRNSLDNHNNNSTLNGQSLLLFEPAVPSAELALTLATAVEPPSEPSTAESSSPSTPELSAHTSVDAVQVRGGQETHSLTIVTIDNLSADLDSVDSTSKLLIKSSASALEAICLIDDSSFGVDSQESSAFPIVRRTSVDL